MRRERTPSNIFDQKSTASNVNILVDLLGNLRLPTNLKGVKKIIFVYTFL